MDLPCLDRPWPVLTWLNQSWLDLLWLVFFFLTMTCPILTCSNLPCLDLTCPDLTSPDFYFRHIQIPNTIPTSHRYPPDLLRAPSRQPQVTHQTPSSQFPNNFQKTIRQSPNIRHVGSFLLLKARWGLLLLPSTSLLKSPPVCVSIYLSICGHFLNVGV